MKKKNGFFLQKQPNHYKKVTRATRRRQVVARNPSDPVDSLAEAPQNPRDVPKVHRRLADPLAKSAPEMTDDWLAKEGFLSFF